MADAKRKRAAGVEPEKGDYVRLSPSVEDFTNTGADYFGLWFFVLISILNRLFNTIFVLRIANSQS